MSQQRTAPTVPGLIFAGIVLLKVAGVGLAAAWSWWFIAGLGAIWLVSRGFVRSVVGAAEAKAQEQAKAEALAKVEELLKK